MRTVDMIVVSLVAALGAFQAAAADSPRESLENDFRSTTFSLLYRRAELPPTLVDYFLARARDMSAPLVELLAEPGEEFNPYCVVKHGVPPARLMFAGSSENVTFALFERGGRSHYLTAVLIGSGKLAGERCVYSLPLEHLSISELKERLLEEDAECN